MTVLKTERMIGLGVVGSNHRIQAVHLLEPEDGKMLDPTEIEVKMESVSIPVEDERRHTLADRVVPN